jgi:hypothetical protein
MKLTHAHRATVSGALAARDLLSKWAKKPDPRDVRSSIRSYITTGCVLIAIAFSVAVVKESGNPTFSWPDVWQNLTPIALGTIVGVAVLAVMHAAVVRRYTRKQPR